MTSKWIQQKTLDNYDSRDIPPAFLQFVFVFTTFVNLRFECEQKEKGI